MMQSRRIDPLLRRAQEHEDAVARELAERQRAHQLQESRLDELRRYAEEYASGQLAAVSPAQLANRRAFLDRLESAVEQQSRNVDSSLQRLEADRARLLGEAQRLLAEDAVHAFLYSNQWITVANKNLKGLWKDMPVFVNDIAGLSWA